MSHPMIDALRRMPLTYHPGWGGPEYTTWQDEQMSWKTTCYVGDWSFLWDLRIDGPDALRLLREKSVNSYETFAVGSGKHMIQCNERGKVNAEGVLLRLGEQSFATQSTTALYTSYLISRGGYDVTVSREPRFKFQVSGPNALAVCEEATGENLRDIKFMRFRSVRIAGVEALALRMGMAGEVGFEFHGPMAQHDAVWSEILRVGEKHGIRRLGRRTAMINHLEAAFPTGNWHFLANFEDGFAEHCAENFDMYGIGIALAGSLDSDDLDDYMLSPVSLGWAKSIKFDHDFLGRQALEREVAHPRHQRVTLEFDSADVVDIYASLFAPGEPYGYIDIPHPQRWVFHADAVHDADGQLVGISSPPGYSFHFRKMLSLGFVDPAHAEPGTEVTVIWGEPGKRQKRIRAVVAPAPYKADKRRVELTDLPASQLAPAI
jgi:glycine cleavage system aminomethyltransferase T